MSTLHGSGLAFCNETNFDAAMVASHQGLRARALQAATASFAGQAALVVTAHDAPAPPPSVLVAGVFNNPAPTLTHTVTVDSPLGIEWRGGSDAPSEAPRLCELLLCLFTKPEDQKERLASYTERFHDWERKFGGRTARRLYYAHALRSGWDFLKIGVIGDLIEKIWNWFTG